MQLHLHQPEGIFLLRRVEPGRITVGDRVLTRSVIIAPDRIIEQWNADDVRLLQPDALEPIVALAPAVVLLGSGERLIFPAQNVLAHFLTRKIGVEVMDNAAAARTFNVLASEGRKVVAAFLLNPAA